MLVVIILTVIVVTAVLALVCCGECWTECCSECCIESYPDDQDTIEKKKQIHLYITKYNLSFYVKINSLNIIII